jgi:cell fate (sporulation/competence/biofilm development) regulator YlbF (YheA/YmcA/DUF963 family)
MSTMTNLAQENFQRWRQMQDAFFKSMMGGNRQPHEDEHKD